MQWGIQNNFKDYYSLLQFTIITITTETRTKLFHYDQEYEQYNHE